MLVQSYNSKSGYVRVGQLITEEDYLDRALLICSSNTLCHWIRGNLFEAMPSYLS